MYDLVSAMMEGARLDQPSTRQMNIRHRFILIALRELGLRASEIVGSPSERSSSCWTKE
jgi:hypothetical protein